MTALTKRIRAQDHFLLVARLSLLLLVVNVNEMPAILVVSAIATGVLFLRPTLLRSPWPWFALGSVVGVAQLLRWWTVDDHIVVTTYWLFAIGLSRLAHERDRVLGEIGRILVGLVFAFAFGWKLLSSQYSSTDFFRYQFLTDGRFVHVAEVAGGTDGAELDAVVDELRTLRIEPTRGASATLSEGSRNHAVARVFTYWGLAIEGLIAAAFLLPLPHRLRALRPATLFAFSFTTYLVVPVAGFAALLMVLALAHRDTPRMRVAYVVSFAGLLVWGAIFPSLV